MKLFRIFTALIVFWLGVSAMGARAQIAAPDQPAAQDAETPTGSVQGYRLGTGDRIRLTVFGEQDLSGEYDVDGSGNLRLNLVGQVKAAGLTLPEFEANVRKALEDGYLKDPKVTAEVINYRPFYIIGEVNKPGEYPYSNDMSILNAVAKAGGYTYRANESNVYIRRNGDTKEVGVPADQTTKIYPGDVIRIPERFF